MSRSLLSTLTAHAFWLIVLLVALPSMPGQTTATAISGTTNLERFGSVLAAGGDVNGDGRPDLAVGAPGRDAGSGPAQGEVTLISGSSGATLWIVSGAAAGDGFGSAVALIADLNADGRSEVAIGSPGFDGVAGLDSGRVTVHSGLDGSVLFTMEGGSAAAAFGTGLAAVGDWNADGLDDLAIGAPGHDGVAGSAAGLAVVRSGADQSTLLSLEGDQAGEGFGRILARGGDADLDDRLDLAVGSPEFDGVAGVASGRYVIVAGRTGATYRAAEGGGAGDRFGASLQGGLDADVDGFADLVVGVPGFDGVAGADSGRTELSSGRTGSVIFAVEGVSAGDEEGAAVALLPSVGNDSRADVATAAPSADLSGTDRGQVAVLSTDFPATSISAAYTTGSQPFAVTSCDADGDGDQDAVVVAAGTVSVFWNTDRVGTTPTGVLDALARTDIALSPGAQGVSVTAGQLDADAACEFVIGRDDGSIDILDGTGSLNSTAFALTTASPFLVDTAVSPGSIAALGIVGSGASATVVCAGAGSLVFDGFLIEVSAPLSAPTLSATLVSGGSFTDVVVGDIDGDLTVDLVAANSSVGAAGGVHVLLGPSFTPTVGSPFSAGTQPFRLTLADLDGTGTTNDVAMASLSFGSGGVRVLADFVIGVGFSAPVDPGLLLARDVRSFHGDDDSSDDLAVLDGAGQLRLLSGWTGAAFASVVTLATPSAAGVALATAQLTTGPAPADPDEALVVHLSEDLLSSWGLRRLFEVRAVANSGCPAGASVAAIALSGGDPVLNGTALRIELTGAAPLAMVFLVAQENLPSGSTPTVSVISGCGLAMSSGDIVQFFGFTNSQGRLSLPAGLPVDPQLVGTEYLVQWGILDGGPLLGSLSVSDAIVVRIGDR